MSMSGSLHYRTAVLGSAMLAFSVASLGAQAANASKGKAKGKATAPAHFSVSAPDLSSKGRITVQHVFNGMGCTGQNVSPALNWSGAPAGTKSFAVTAYDPDGANGKGWVHRGVEKLPGDATGVAGGGGNWRNGARGSQPGRDEFGTKGNGGPCPPAGDKPHHYHFKVFALKVDKLDVPGDATAAMVGYNLNANKLATATVTGLYAR